MTRARLSPADLLTVGNGICGFLGLAVVARLWIASPGAGMTHRELVGALTLYGIGMLCDVGDGPVARRFGSSGLGPGLDVETAWDTGAFVLRGVEGPSGVQQQALPLTRGQFYAVAADFARGAVDGYADNAQGPSA